MTAPGAPSALTCVQCGADVPGDAKFCEACGADLPAGPVSPVPPLVPADAATQATPAPARALCRDCGGTVDDDGYCTTCGAKAPRERDRFTEQPQAWVAGVCDRGIRHGLNEDAMALAADAAPGSRAVLVVCDGVSSSQDSDVASLAAARAARAALLSSRAQGVGTGSALVAAIGARLAAATDAASEAVVATTRADHGDNPPSCTFVAAVVERDLVVAAVVGDSRAYWLPDAGPAAALTVDDSWAAQQIAAGTPRAAAESGPQAHAITRWLGVDAPDHAPRLTSVVADVPGWLLVCSDGLWNYCSAADDLADLVHATAASAGADPLATASALVDWANTQGGHDNITVALARLGADPTQGDT